LLVGALARSGTDMAVIPRFAGPGW